MDRCSLIFPTDMLGRVPFVFSMQIGLLKIKYFDFNSYESVCGIIETTASMAGSFFNFLIAS